MTTQCTKPTREGLRRTIMMFVSISIFVHTYCNDSNSRHSLSSHLATMDALFESFVSDHLRISEGLTVGAADVVATYVAFNNGSTIGKIKLYAYLQALPGISKLKTNFYSFELITKHKQTPMPVNQQQPTTMSEFEQKTLEIAERKMKLKEAMKQRELATDEAMKQQELATHEAMKQQELATHEAMKQQELATHEAMKQRELAAQEAMKQRELAAQEAMKYMEITSNEAIAKSKIASQEAMKQMDLDDKERDRAFIREENNKNHRMYLSNRFNKYIDFQVYGSPQTQYITQESLTDVLGFNAYNALGSIDQYVQGQIINEIANVANEVPVVKNGLIDNVMAVKVDEVKTIISNVVEACADASPRLSVELDSVAQHANAIPEVAIRDEQRCMESLYNLKKNDQDPVKHKNMKAKIDYMKPLNQLIHNDDGIQIKCYCCQAYVKMNKAGCHRAHDIPRSDGGDCSIANIYLTCATCNQAMGDSMSVIDYKTELYVTATTHIT
jgi:hypothetical protein